jgi:anhydro-N-acetylmuramic acid kinase
MEELGKSLQGLGITLERFPDAVVDFKEAVIFAFLGLHTLLGQPNVLSTATGAKMDVCAGSIHFPPGGWKGLELI